MARSVQLFTGRDAPFATDVPGLYGRTDGHVEASLRQPGHFQGVFQQLHGFRTGFDGAFPCSGVDPGEFAVGNPRAQDLLQTMNFGESLFNGIIGPLFVLSHGSQKDQRAHVHLAALDHVR